MPLTRRHLWFALPLLVAGGSGAGFYDILRRMRSGIYNPHALPSPLVGKHLPDFKLPGAAGLQGFSQTDFQALAQPVLVNWFASWCEPCQQETSVLHGLAASGRAIWGVAYEDSPQALTAYLQNFGNPYQRLGTDQSGLTAINWGVYGVPETYFIDKSGIVRLRYAGPLDNQFVEQGLVPLFKQYS